MAQNWDVAADTKAIYETMAGMGTHEENLNNLVFGRSRDHLEKVFQQYNRTYGKGLKPNLDTRIKRECSGRHQKVLIAMLEGGAEYRAMTILESMSGIGTEEEVLIDSICTASTKEIHATMEHCREHGKNLINIVKRDTSGDFQKLLVAILEGTREVGINQAQVEPDMHAIFDAADGFGTDEHALIQIIAKRSPEHLSAVGHLFQKTHGKDLKKTIMRETRHWFEEALLACFMGPAEYTAVRIHDSVHGLGTDEELVCMLVLIPDEKTLADASRRYRELYDTDMAEHVDGDCGGDWGHGLAARIKFAASHY